MMMENNKGEMIGRGSLADLHESNGGEYSRISALEGPTCRTPRPTLAYQ